MIYTIYNIIGLTVMFKNGSTIYTVCSEPKTLKWTHRGEDRWSGSRSLARIAYHLNQGFMKVASSNIPVERNELYLIHN